MHTYSNHYKAYKIASFVKLKSLFIQNQEILEIKDGSGSGKFDKSSRWFPAYAEIAGDRTTKVLPTTQLMTVGQLEEMVFNSFQM